MTTTLEEALAMASGPWSRLAVQYSCVMRDLVAQAKQPGFTAADWTPLAEFVAVDEFVRIGNFLEKVSWDQYDDLLTMWGKSTEWDFTVRRVTEGDRYAILELAEVAKYASHSEAYDSVSIYDFNEAGKIKRLRIYLARAEPLESAQVNSWNWEEVSAEIVQS